MPSYLQVEIISLRIPHPHSTVVRIVRRISHENRFIPELMMGVDTPIPPIMIGAAAPDGAPPRRINY